MHPSQFHSAFHKKNPQEGESYRKWYSKQRTPSRIQLAQTHNVSVMSHAN
jgi:hypothetical protein